MPLAIDAPDPNHHLWKNGRYYWIAYTLIHQGWRQERVRRSLNTDDLFEARRRRDVILDGYRDSLDPVLSLRVLPASRRRTGELTVAAAAARSAGLGAMSAERWPATACDRG